MSDTPAPAEAPSAPEPLPADIAALPFEDALAELEQIVRQLEQGNVRLEDAIAAFTRGRQLQRHCQSTLDAARARIEKLVVDEDGVKGTEPFGESSGETAPPF